MPEANCQYDIAIIGGGLAGLSLAIQGADAGFRVILFEKEQYPFHKVCGEYISMESRDFLLRCGAPLDNWDLPEIHRLNVSDVQGREYHFALPLGGFGVSRYRLDNALYKIALQKGATVLTQTKVSDVKFINDLFTITANGTDYTVAVAAGAYGKKSNLDLKWNRGFIRQKPGKIDNLVGVKYHIRYPHDAGTISLHNFHNGYCGMSQIENGDSCLCYLTTAANLQTAGNSITEMEKKVLSQNPKLKEIFSDAKFLYDQPLTISQISFQEKTQVEDHLLMIGDAAGMITPLCGNGMSMGMHAAKIAFDTIGLFLDKKISRQGMENLYEEKWNRQFATRTRVGRIVQSLFGGNLSTSLFLRTMHGLPFLGRQLIKTTHGDTF